jgi:hypothetical protein
VRRILTLLSFAAFLAPLACAVSDPTEPSAEARLIRRPAACAKPAPLYGDGESVPGAYIVVFHDYVSDPAAYAQRLAELHGFQLTFAYTHALRGFAASMSDGALAQVRCARGVHYVEEDRVISIGG